MSQIENENNEEDLLEVQLAVRRSEIIKLADDGSAMVLNPEAEDAVLQLLALQELVDSTIALVKERIVEAGLALDPAFTTVAGDKLKANYSFSGAKYKLQKGRKEFPAPLFKRKVAVSIDSKEMEKYEIEHRKLPKFVERASRKQHLNFKARG